jgi:hypothetical protein
VIASYIMRNKYAYLSVWWGTRGMWRTVWKASLDTYVQKQQLVLSCLVTRLITLSKSSWQEWSFQVYLGVAGEAGKGIAG